jgi:hypothetical protein
MAQYNYYNAIKIYIYIYIKKKRIYREWAK